jgi:hypothetical protein
MQSGWDEDGKKGKDLNFYTFDYYIKSHHPTLGKRLDHHEIICSTPPNYNSNLGNNTSMRVLTSLNVFPPR